MLGTYLEIPIRGIVKDGFSLLSKRGFLKKFTNENSLSNNPLVVLLIGSANHIIISKKIQKRTKNLYPQSALCLFHNPGLTLKTID